MAAVLFAPGVAKAEQAAPLKGVALVIGNGDYKHIAALPNPANDARAVEEMLDALGFETTISLDRDARRLKRDLEGFLEDAKGADVAVLYYSGHGIETFGENFLVPVDADPGSLDDVSERLAPLAPLLEGLKAVAPVTIVMLDACRNNPFPAGATVSNGPASGASPIGTGLGAPRGAAQLSQPAQARENYGTVIGFAAEPGHAALDGPAGGNSPYAAAVLRHLTTMQGEEFGTVMRMVAEEVYLKTGGKQRPWVNESLRRLLYFGASPTGPTGDEGDILKERRQLLLTIAALPDAGRRQIETIAQTGGVPMDALYGMLAALGADAPGDPAELDRLLRAQTVRLKQMLAERDALKSADPEIAQLTALADKALAEGALATSIRILGQAKQRVSKLDSDVDQAESQLRAKRVEFASVYARSGEANYLAFEYLKAATDYALAFEQVQKWDTELAWRYKYGETEALIAHGDRRADRQALLKALDTGQAALDIATGFPEPFDAARSLAAIGNALYTLGTREGGTERLEAAAEAYRQAGKAWDPELYPQEWADAQNSIGNALWAIGERQAGTARLEEAAAAYSAAIVHVSRRDAPFVWGQAQNNLGNTLAAMATREASIPRLEEAIAAYDAALQELTFEAAPYFFGVIQSNRGKALSAIGQMDSGIEHLDQALDAFDLALRGSPRDALPLQWATVQMNAAIVLEVLASRVEPARALELRHQAVEAYTYALEEMTPEGARWQRAMAQHNLAITLQSLSLSESDAAMRLQLLDVAAVAQREALAAMTRETEPLLWAKLNSNFAKTLRMRGHATLTADAAAFLQESATRYRAVLEVATRERDAFFWAMNQTALGQVLQALAETETDPERAVSHLREAAAGQRRLVDAYWQQDKVVEWALALHDLGYSFMQLGERGGGAESYRQAEAAYREEISAYSRDASPLYWAKAQAGIGNALRGIGLETLDRQTLVEARRRTKEARAAIQPFDTSYNGILDDRLAEIDAALSSLK